MGKEIYHAKEDPKYQSPYVDLEEDRERTLPDGTTLPYRYVHGGFGGTNVKFILCFPEKGEFKGRFYQYLSPFPGPDEELASVDKQGEDDIIAFCLKNGAYFVESNMGSKAMFGPDPEPERVYQSSAAVAEYSRTKAMEYYECTRPYGYVYGGSGGGYKTMACIENTDAWDGALPYVIGSPVSLPNTIMLHVQGQRCLRRVFGKIVDALDAGGSGNMYEGLTENEAAMLREITDMGFPPEAWFLEAAGQIDDGSLQVLMPLIKMGDPGYFEDFWKVPGYLGTDPESSAVKDRLQFEGIVKSVHGPGSETDENAVDGRNDVNDAWQKMMTDGNGAWIELEEVPHGDLYLKGVNIIFQTGESEGQQLLLDDIKGNCLLIGQCYGMDDLDGVLSKVRPGDRLRLDNSDYIAIQSYYRHQVPEDLSFHAWDQFRDEEGKPAFPQRKNILGYTMTGTGTVQDGDIQGKVMVMQSLMDESTCPWCGDWYRNKVKETKGTDENIHLYYMEHCMHDRMGALAGNRVTDYRGALRQALLDLGDWVEKGKEPVAPTVYERNGGQIRVPEEAKDRKGMQPAVELLANGSSCARVKAGGTVCFTVRVKVPEGAGEITAIRYDVEDAVIPSEDPVFQNMLEFEKTDEDGCRGAKAEFTYSYKEPGVHFASVLVESNRYGDRNDIFTQVKNLARVRVIAE